MSQIFSEETHRNMLARIPRRTGREIADWMRTVEEGPPSSASRSGSAGSAGRTTWRTATRRRSCTSTTCGGRPGDSSEPGPRTGPGTRKGPPGVMPDGPLPES